MPGAVLPPWGAFAFLPSSGGPTLSQLSGFVGVIDLSTSALGQHKPYADALQQQRKRGASEQWRGPAQGKAKHGNSGQPRKVE
ncbi:hypothetical protein BCV69DRAFT_285685 [Microstroma glucosiphilum]|uniref:Uncharacterized protein n=1 Tax=Pseudomicrostroma glucosiphilum TaxID=1684307 RepID=A0A316TWF1_9BASI|nr:hypothetical protein BCV69DRAFT_285685 [Pseudomicrostroma glucosiphilum]PWN17806.1 hypothetical protein BCV69DRAFT_285685 [Pseudomicrostroma glucosiphilum]